MNPDPTALRNLIVGMRAAYGRRENAMEYARRSAGTDTNALEATLIAYDLQTGNYVARVRRNPAGNERWCTQLAAALAPEVTAGGSLLEVGCGEATTLAGVLAHLPAAPAHALGLDISWSRCAQGLDWLAEQGGSARLFVADLFAIPLADASVDVVYTSHSLEPNGGREEAALRELLRVARRAVVLCEPIFELGGNEAQARMLQHGYVRGLEATAGRLGARVTPARLLPYSPNPLNPSGVIILEKAGATAAPDEAPAFRCPLTGTPLVDAGDAFCSPATGIVYPVLRGIPLLRTEHAVVASKFEARALVS